MKLEINETEINNAIIAYVNTLGLDTTGKDVEVSIVAGRGSNGNKAEIEITEVKAQTDVKTPAPSLSTDTKTEEDDSLFSE